jgi:signal transduction histidine kinase
VVHARGDEDEHGSWAVVTIEDRGLGIPAADLPYVFDRFRRGGNVQRHIAGSGIGLTGAKQIVAQHGGAISVQSVEGEGSTFTLRLPLLTGGGDGSRWRGGRVTGIVLPATQPPRDPTTHNP